MPLRLCCRALRMITRSGEGGITSENTGQAVWRTGGRSFRRTHCPVVRRSARPALAGGRGGALASLHTCPLPSPRASSAAGSNSSLWSMKRGGVRLPEAVTSTFMTFVATVVFFAIAGPLAIYFGAGKSLARHHVVLGITYYGLFRTSLTIFGVLGVLMLFAMIFPVW